MPDDHLALALAVTVRHDGHGGIADDLADPAGLTAWVDAHRSALARYGFAPQDARAASDETARAAVVGVRTALRALFARAVLPGTPSGADAGRLPDARSALERLNADATRVPVSPAVAWPPDAQPVATCAVPGRHAPADLLAAALARAGVAFLTGPDLARLRACPAPRCVRYFVQSHARQEWCKPSCGNRARVARHHARRRGEAEGRVP